jgi:hypothetical protein
MQPELKRRDKTCLLVGPERPCCAAEFKPRIAESPTAQRVGWRESTHADLPNPSPV